MFLILQPRKHAAPVKTAKLKKMTEALWFLL